MELKPLPNAKGEKRDKKEKEKKTNKTLKEMKKNNIPCIVHLPCFYYFYCLLCLPDVLSPLQNNIVGFSLLICDISSKPYIVIIFTVLVPVYYVC